MSNIYIAEKEQLDNQNTLLSTYNSTLQDIEDDLSDIATLAEQKQIKTVTPTKQKQIIEADEGYNSLASVIVNPSPPPVLITKQITENGTYFAEDDNADGYSEVTVDVPSGVPIDEESLTPLVFGIDSDGFYFSDTPADETLVLFGRDVDGIYVAGGATA